MMNRFSNAFIAAVLAGIIVAPVFGLQIIRTGMTTHLESDWQIILIGMALVFVVQLIRPNVNRTKVRESRWTLPKLSMQHKKILLYIVIACAVVWPFLVVVPKWTLPPWC